MSSNIILRVPVDDRKRFTPIIEKYYKDITISDIKYMNIDDFLRFIPQNSTDLGMAGLLWKRYMGR